MEPSYQIKGVIYTFSIEISTGSEINENLHDGVAISLGTPIGALNILVLPIIVLFFSESVRTSSLSGRLYFYCWPADCQ